MLLDKGLIDADDLCFKETEIQKKHLGKLYERFEHCAENLLPLEKKLIILIDIVGFSKSDTYKQWADIMIFQHYLKTQTLKNKLIFRQVNVTHFVPTGDGCYVIADECDPKVGIEFAFSIIQGFQKVQPRDEYPLCLRASALLGNVVPFMDVAMHKNYVGEGMNEGSRILSWGQKTLEDAFVKSCKEKNYVPGQEEVKSYSRNSLFLGDSLASFSKDYISQCNEVFYFENVKDKHGKERNITVLQGIKSD